ncbi:MAG: gas vesicle protein [Gemmatimonadaceae bacterium]
MTPDYAPRPAPFQHAGDPADGDRLELVELLNRVLDKGVVVHGEVTLAVADIDLVQLDLTIILSAVETAARRAARPERGVEAPGADVRVLPPDGAR